MAATCSFIAATRRRFSFFFSLGNLSSLVFVLLSVGYVFFFFFVCFDFDLFAAPNLGLIIMIMTLTMAMAMKTMMIKLLGCLIFCNLIEPSANELAVVGTWAWHAVSAHANAHKIIT